MSKYSVYRWGALVALVIFADAAYAHKPADSYLRLRVEGNSVAAEWDIALADLEATAKLQTHGDQKAIKEFALQHLLISAGSAPCALQLDEAPQGSNVLLPSVNFHAQCLAGITSLTIDYSPLLTIDRQYRGLVFIQAGHKDYTATLSVENPYFLFQLAPENGRMGWWRYLQEKAASF